MCTLTGSYGEQDPRDVGFALTSALADNDTVRDSHLDLGRVPYGLYAGKYIDLVSLGAK